MITGLLILYHRTNVQYICTAEFIKHNLYRNCYIHIYIMQIYVQYIYYV